MTINRYELVTRHNPVLTEADVSSPLSVGNGDFAYTADITGMQTLYGTYKETLPLCTMAQWAWHTKPVGDGRYAYDPQDVELTEYPHRGRTVAYAVEKKPGNEEVYDWLRQNPHKLNLARIGLILEEERGGDGGGMNRNLGGADWLDLGQITGIRQELHLYEGILESHFSLRGKVCQVTTVSDSQSDAVTFQIKSEALQEGLAVGMAFPYGSHLISASDWQADSSHVTQILHREKDRVVLSRSLDRDAYQVTVTLEDCSLEQKDSHFFVLLARGSQMAFTVCFEKAGDTRSGAPRAWEENEENGKFSHREVCDRSRRYWKGFWEKGGAVDLHRSRDPRAMELERRIVLSQYLLAIQSASHIPPQETGLTCNSWYGKFHLEMYLWHAAWLPLWNHRDLLARSLAWYEEHLPEARQNAAHNGYKGARWPKMVAADALDSPSPIGTLLVWQQPHIIYMLEMAYRNCLSERNQGSLDGGLEFLEKYNSLVQETADFMVDFAVYDAERGVYDLLGPVIPVQETHAPMDTKNPAFEVEYWRFTLEIAAEWARRLGRSVPEKWQHVAGHMAPMAVGDGRYLAHEACPDTYEKYATDHPSMLCAYGLIDGGRTDRRIMENSLRKVEACWNYPSLWGWDFAVMAMTATRLGDPEYAISLLLKDSWKNCYVASGNNFQKGRKDLPLYLPGNGSLLLAIPLMTAGYPGSGPLPGFPKDGQWEVLYENIDPFPY